MFFMSNVYGTPGLSDISFVTGLLIINIGATIKIICYRCYTLIYIFYWDFLSRFFMSVGALSLWLAGQLLDWIV